AGETDRDVRDALLARPFRSQVELRLVDVEADRPPVRRHPPGELERRISSSAPRVEADEAVAQVELVEERHRGLVHDAGEEPQALPAGGAATDHVLLLRIRHRSPPAPKAQALRGSLASW